ncbi:crossover junction endonuclease EME1 [Pogonomyrmex barbatus]|uniref:Crossover junction endonuclease EME1 n=1 Tax=Pogonomyrmex barbatus TaxID=144034 RepID=A0A6I9WZ89_9HYME|nr:crossover junction endonuclease EME1 [Pogonomyrmex barbatus]XP_011645464.1 crossover junction endonuclease EME1 [Pogonomyrmex barbatus]XP_025075468.1 crossover junction endonuclease EME1 [Pogonomyrmex barbatus]XP_025075469.1 crossover junction endonuclease EME1 [Pogonomyrmex barbatus]
MSRSVIVLSDSDEPASPVADKYDRNKSQTDGYHSDIENIFDFPKVPFCHEYALLSASQNKNSFDLNEHFRESPMSDSEENQIEKSSRKTAVSKRDKTTSKEERSKRQQALAREKALKAIEKKTSRDMKPGECIKFMEVNLDRHIDTFVSREEIESALRNVDIKFKITTELIPNSITWQRNVEEDYIDEDNKVRTKSSIQIEEHVIVIWSNYEAVKHVAEGTFCTSISNSKDLIPSYSMTLVIYGMEEYFTYRKKQKSDQNPGSKGPRYNGKNNQQLDTLPIISRQQLEMCLAEIQIVAKCSSRLIENAQDLALMVYQYTKSISEIPYKLQKKGNQESKFDWYVMGDNKNTVRVDKDGNGLKRLWQQQLCQFNLSSLETSEAICMAYPSPAQLIKAYRNCTPDEGVNLLKDISIRRAAGPITAARKIGPELSKKMYVMFTSQNGDALLGNEM